MVNADIGCAVWGWRGRCGTGRLERAHSSQAGGGEDGQTETMLDRETSDESQAQLLRRIATQDRQALTEFYDQTAGMFFSIAVRILGDTHEAEEVVQDVFVQIWSKAGTFNRALGAPIHWAVGITRNRSIDRLRARQRRARVLEEATELSDNHPVASSQQSNLSLSEEELVKVRSAVKSLPQDQQQAIEMAFFNGLTHQEIAATLNEPLGTVKARIRRGMLKLRDSLQAYT
jgi:RNA polymerase sigma-70 factor (ECF subfamily)